MNIAIIGYGKMGQTIDQLIGSTYTDEHAVVCRVDTSAVLEQNIFTWENLGDHLPAHLGIDVAIEFSRPEAAVSNLVKCFKSGIPVVCGTTGWYAHLPEIISLCKKYNGALLYAANFSLSVNIMLSLNHHLASLMHRFGSDYALQIDEIHHTQKLDAPSGTAIALAQGIMSANKNKKRWINIASDDASDIPILSHRESDVPGTHTVVYESEIDKIVLQHIAYSRTGFARGAIVAGAWLKGKSGVFTMSDVLSF